MIYLGADHRGYFVKERLKSWLALYGILHQDLGAPILSADDDYSDYAALVAREVAKKPDENRGILVCGSGAGVCVTANKFRGIRAALALNPEMARSARNDDDANVLCLAADFTSEDDAVKIADIWLHTPFGNEERYKRRISKISDIESSLWRID
jgi:ribose 5-phosphate isomerase B